MGTLYYYSFLILFPWTNFDRGLEKTTPEFLHKKEGFTKKEKVCGSPLHEQFDGTDR
jgi:hypothetical protein